MNSWSVVGVVMILAGLVVLFLLWGFIVTIVVAILELIAVAIGIILILGGVAAVLFGGRSRKKRMWGPAPTDT